MTRICFTEDRFEINGKVVSLPYQVKDLKNILGESDVFASEHNEVYIWSDLGLKAYSKDGQTVDIIDVIFQPEDYELLS